MTGTPDDAVLPVPPAPSLRESAAGPDRHVQAMRLRLYRPGATAEDVAAFAAAASAAVDDSAPRATATSPSAPPPDAVDASAPPASASEQESRGPASRKRSGARIAVLVALAAALPVALLAALLIRVDGSTSDPVADPTASAVAVTPPAVTPSVADSTATSAEERADFIRRLTEGRQAGVSAYLDRHADDLPAALAQATRSDTLEFAGDGTGSIALDPPSIGGDDGGRVTVVLVLGADADATWTLVRTRTDDPAQGVAVGSASGGQVAGAPTAATISYAPGRRPVRLQVVAPPGVRWGVAAVFSD